MVVLTKVPSSLPEQNVEGYIAGCLLRKTKVLNCQTCKQQLIYAIPPDAEDYTFLTKKALKIKNTLVCPTEPFIVFVDNLEVYFIRVFDAVKYVSFVLLRLCKNAEGLYKDFLQCTSMVCNAKLHAMVKFYFKVRVFHALKMSNRENKNRKGCKQNRKMLKLQHL